jgi:hypothetical protein
MVDRTTPRRAGHTSVFADVSTLAGARRQPPWYRSGKLAAALVVAIGVAASWGAISVLDTPDGAPPAVSPAGRPDVAPPPIEGSRGDPIQVAPPMPPPPPPPPPPTAERTEPGPVYRNPYPRSSPAPSSDGPEIGVTRTPVTRAPISVAPAPRKSPGNDSSTPGDAPKRGGWPW